MQGVIASILVLGMATAAQAQTFFFHQSTTPVPVPGGSSEFFLDQTVPSGTTPVVAEEMISTGDTETFPAFSSTPFAANTSLRPIASVRLNLSANQKMRSCADLGVIVHKLDTAGNATYMGNELVLDLTVPQGKSGGTVGFQSFRIEFPVSNTSLLAGEGIVVAPSATNHCGVSRRVFLAYDSLNAPTRVRFQCCFTVEGKCAEGKMKAASKKSTCLLGLEAKEAAKGEPADPLKADRCHEKLDLTFQDLESDGGCITAGDAAAIEAKVDDFVADVDGALNPGGPPNANKCQGAKIKAVGKKASCLLSLEAKAAGKGIDVDAVKAEKCRTKFALAFAKLEEKGECATTGDAASIEATVDAFVADVASALACPCP